MVGTLFSTNGITPQKLLSLLAPANAQEELIYASSRFGTLM
jgi:hypothetical protein